MEEWKGDHMYLVQWNNTKGPGYENEPDDDGLHVYSESYLRNMDLDQFVDDEETLMTFEP